MKKSNISEDIIGTKYERLTVIGFEHAKSPSRNWKWIVKCECGNVKTFFPGDVRKGKVRSCGCLHNELAKERASKFRNPIAENKRLYNIYNNMKSRCFKPNDSRYKDYGGRGIAVCEEWAVSFDVFADWAKANGYRNDLTIERVDVNGDYCPENCEWIPLKEQAKNKRDTVWVEYKGERVKLQDLAEIAVVQYDALHNRITKGWDVEEAITTPSANECVSLRARCDAKGIKYTTVLNRKNRLGWDEDAALNTPVRSMATSVT